MLSKSAARAFFLTGTLVCAGAFGLLTIDTIKRVPGQTKEQNITEAVAKGKHLWETNNCMGCHTILGEGAYYAPELTKVFERRGESFIRSMLKDPQAMYPGQRKMVKYNFSDQEIDSLVAFLKWIGEMDLNGFPAKPDLQTTAAVAQATAESLAGMPASFNTTCVACHSFGGKGGEVGPKLDQIGATRDLAFLKAWLKDPMAIKADSKMPKLPLTDAEIEELSQFLANQK